MSEKGWGYRGICKESGKNVREDEAYDYALAEVKSAKDEELTKDFIEFAISLIDNGEEDHKKEMVDWFFSGNWINEEIEESEFE